MGKKRKRKKMIKNETLIRSTAIAHNLKIEPMLIHPTKWGYRNNKNKMKNKKKKSDGK